MVYKGDMSSPVGLAYDKTWVDPGTRGTGAGTNTAEGTHDAPRTKASYA